MPRSTEYIDGWRAHKDGQRAFFRDLCPYKTYRQRESYVQWWMGYRDREDAVAKAVYAVDRAVLDKAAL